MLCLQVFVFVEDEIKMICEGLVGLNQNSSSKFIALGSVTPPFSGFLHVERDSKWDHRRVKYLKVRNPPKFWTFRWFPNLGNPMTQGYHHHKNACFRGRAPGYMIIYDSISSTQNMFSEWARTVSLSQIQQEVLFGLAQVGHAHLDCRLCPTFDAFPKCLNGSYIGDPGTGNRIRLN